MPSYEKLFPPIFSSSQGVESLPKNGIYINFQTIHFIYGGIILAFLLVIFILGWRKLRKLEKIVSNVEMQNGALVVDNGDITINGGNLYVEGDGQTTGYINARYLTLKDYTSNNKTYLYADQNTLLWDSGGTTVPFVPPVSFNVLGWVEKTKQTQVVKLLPHTPNTGTLNYSLDQTIDFLNNMILEFSNRGLIYLNPGPAPTPDPPLPGPPPNPVNTLRSKNLLVNSGGVNSYKETLLTKYASGTFPILYVIEINNRSGVIDHVIDKVSSIQSLQLNFYSNIYQSVGQNHIDGGELNFPGLQFFLNDANKTNLANKLVYTANRTFVQTRNTNLKFGFGCNVSTTGDSTGIPLSNDPEIETGDLFITDQNQIAKIFNKSSAESTLSGQTLTLNPSWAIFQIPALYEIGDLRMTRFIINYFQNT